MPSLTKMNENFAFADELLNKQIITKKETVLVVREYRTPKKEDFKDDREITVPARTLCTILSTGSLRSDYSTGMIQLSSAAVTLKPNEDLVIQAHYSKMKETFEEHFEHAQ